MNLNQMQTFLEVARTGSVTQAARLMGVSQPAITQQIRRLETELGVPLLDRGEDRLTLTEAGEEFRRFAERVVADYRELLRRLPAQGGVLRGTLRLGASTIPGEFVVPRIVAGFKELHPNVQVSVAIFDTAEVVGRLLDGEFEVGFVGAEAGAPGLVVSKLTEDILVLVVPPAHPFARRESVRFEELTDQPLILREVGSGTMRSLARALAERGLELPHDNVIMRLGSSQAVASAVAAGLGIGFVSSFTAMAESPGRLVPVSLEGLNVKRNLYYLYRQASSRNRVEEEFLAFLQRWTETSA
ncbi:MAG: LysR substrate-binding domain-containing protein [Chloroflexota bacterium]